MLDLKNVNLGKHDLCMKELLEIHERFGRDPFALISYVFKLGFARGQKAGKRDE